MCYAHRLYFVSQSIHIPIYILEGLSRNGNLGQREGRKGVKGGEGSCMTSHFYSNSPNLTWRDIQYLIVYTANPNILSRAGWKMNGAGRQFHLKFGFGAIDTEAMVTRAKHWVTVPAQVTSTVSVATTRYEFLKSI